MINTFKNIFKFSNILYDQRFTFGQAGKLKLTLNQNQYNVNIKTIWEDYTDIKITSNIVSNYYLKQINEDFHDQNIELIDQTNISSDILQVQCSIPEYYSYDINVNGDVSHLPAEIDAKLMGNIKIQARKFIGNKIKSEVSHFHLENLQIHKYIETQFLNIFSQEMTIKKLAIANKGEINVKNCKIESLYIQKPRIQQVIANDIKLGDLMMKYRDESLQFVGFGDKLEINNVHGCCILNQEKIREIKIGNLNGMILCNIKQCDLLDIQIDQLEQGWMKVNGKMILRVYKGEVIVEDIHQGKRIGEGKKTLYVDCQDLEIVEIERKSRRFR